jgi:hypothetical protein
MTVKSLIDRAAEKVGNRHKLAETLGCTKSQVYDWHAGTKKCHAPDRARLASIVGDDPVQELVRATLEETEGTTRGDQLKKVLGKSLQAIGVGLHFVVVAVLISGTSGPTRAAEFHDVYWSKRRKWSYA